MCALSTKLLFTTHILWAKSGKVCACLRLLLMTACKFGVGSIHNENQIMKLTEKMGLQTRCNVLNYSVINWIDPDSWVSSNHFPPVYPVSRDLNLFALNSTVYTTNSKAYHLLPVPHKPSVPVSPLPPLCVCEFVCTHASTRMFVTTCVSLKCVRLMSVQCFITSGVIFRIYLHTLLVHNWHPSLSCLMRYHYINLLTK